jgi:tetratricopeptide (TPR) repeat protein
LFWQFLDGQLKLAGICPFNKDKQSKGVMMAARKFFSIGVIIMMSLLGAQAFAAGSDDYAATAAKPAAYNKALALIKDKNYDQAIVKLKQAEVSAKKDADIQNLLGFAHRKSGELDEAANYYKSALALDPKHKGVLEYQGELFLMLGDKVSAEKNLQKLDKICWLGCSELDDLRTAIRNYKP